MPLAYNPGALSRAQCGRAIRCKPTRCPSQKQARKEVHQVQLGLSARRPLPTDGEIVGQVYGGTRTLFNPLTFAVVGVDRQQGGGGRRLTLPAIDRRHYESLEHRRRRAVAERRPKELGELQRRGAGDRDLPHDLASRRGRSRSTSASSCRASGPYVRDELDDRALARHAWCSRRSGALRAAGPLVGDGRDDSGDPHDERREPDDRRSRRVSRRSTRCTRTSASAFETPTTTELGNQADGSAGLNRDLKPQFSTTYEVGREGLGSLAACNTTSRCSRPRFVTS